MGEITFHTPVMLNKVIQFLNIKSKGIYVDATVGTGGHSKEILRNLKGEGLLIGFDKDEESLNIAEKILKEISSNFLLFNRSFHELPYILEKLRIEKIDGIIYDFGLSSYQLEKSKRGFSFRNLEEPLDMRFSKEGSLKASDILNLYDKERLMKIFKEYGEEPFYRKITEEIIKEREKRKFEKVEDLVRVIERIIPRRGKIHPATKIFQALRIEVNDELNNISKALREIISYINPQGRIVVLSYHSLEDRIVKNFLREKEREGEIKIITKKVVTPSPEEIKINPRSRSAKMRVGEKI